MEESIKNIALYLGPKFKKKKYQIMSHTAAEITGILFYVKGQITLISHYYMTLQFYNI